MTVVIDNDGLPLLLADLDAEWLLELAENTEVKAREAEREKLRIGSQWCVLHEVDDPAEAASWCDAGGQYADVDTPIGSDGTPMVAGSAAAPFAAALGLSTTAGLNLLADVLDLEHRLPRTWARVENLEVPAWRGKRLAQATRSLSKRAARYVDRRLVGIIDSVGVIRIEREVAEAAAKFDPDEQEALEDAARANWGVDLNNRTDPGWVGTSQLEATGDTATLSRFHDLVNEIAHALLDPTQPADQQPTLGQRQIMAIGIICAQATGQADPADPQPSSDAKVRLFAHFCLTDAFDPLIKTGVVEKLGPLTISAIQSWAGSTQCTITPVLDMSRTEAVDAHDPPAWMQELVVLRDRTCVFPWCDRDSRDCDLDHIKAYLDMLKGGPPGQTHPGNLAPLCRRHHRLKTHRRWRYRRNLDGTYTWTSPAGRHYTVHPEGAVHAR